MTELNTYRIFAHRENIKRYRRLLKTKLTFDERRYIERRLAQEQAALERLNASQPVDADMLRTWSGAKKAGRRAPSAVVIAANALQKDSAGGASNSR
ncbi:MAG TPA: hypothetical protein VHG27_04140 [Xanthobacteraceae bacterium]|nr:hypothetical protein [Xanthobacteraceae bacterium]